MWCLVLLRLTSELPLHVDQLVDHQSLSDGESGQRCIVLPPLQNTATNIRDSKTPVLMKQVSGTIGRYLKHSESTEGNIRLMWLWLRCVLDHPRIISSILSIKDKFMNVNNWFLTYKHFLVSYSLHLKFKTSGIYGKLPAVKSEPPCPRLVLRDQQMKQVWFHV